MTFFFSSKAEWTAITFHSRVTIILAVKLTHSQNIKLGFFLDKNYSVLSELNKYINCWDFSYISIEIYFTGTLSQEFFGSSNGFREWWISTHEDIGTSSFFAWTNNLSWSIPADQWLHSKQ